MVQGSASTPAQTPAAASSSRDASSSGNNSTYKWAPVVQAKGAARKEIEYVLKFRQQPRQARMCGVGDKADRRPIDPPPVVQLTVVDKALLSTSSKANQQLSAREKAMAASNSSKGKSKDAPSDEDQPAGQTYLQNPYYLMNATLVRADNQQDLHLLKDGKTRYTLGSTVSSLFQLKDEDKTDAGFFVFPDLSVRVEGEYRLKLDLYEIVGDELHFCKTIVSDAFQVYTAKRFPGNQQSTNMTKLLSVQGIKVRTHHAAAPSRPNSTRKLSTSSSKRKVDLSQDPSSSAMVKTESSGSGSDRPSTFERRGSEASSKRPRTTGGLSSASIGRDTSGRPVSHETQRSGSFSSQHDQEGRYAPPLPSWGPPPPGQHYGHPNGVTHNPPYPGYPPASHSYPHHPPPPPPVDQRGVYRDHREAWANGRANPYGHPDARMEEAWRSSSRPAPMDGQLGPSGQPQYAPAVDLSRPTLPPLSSFQSSDPNRPGSYPRPLTSASSGSAHFPIQQSLNDPRFPPRSSIGGSSEAGSQNRSSMSSVMSDRFSISSERPSPQSSDPSSYRQPSLSSDQHGGAAPGLERFPATASRSSGLPSIKSFAEEDDSARRPPQMLSLNEIRTGYGSTSSTPALGHPPSISAVPRLPSLSEMMAQSSVRGETAPSTFSPLGTPQASSQPFAPQDNQDSPHRAPPSQGGRMGLGNLLASPVDK